MHRPQLPGSDAPVDALYAPALQRSQAVAPDAAEYAPAAQSAQPGSARPVAPDADPAAQLTQPLAPPSPW